MGLPKLCPPNNINKIDKNVLFTYLSQHYSPKRMVLAGVGVEHQRLVEAAKKYFLEEKPVWETEDGLILPTKGLAVDESVAQYTGGIVLVNKLIILLKPFNN